MHRSSGFMVGLSIVALLAASCGPAKTPAPAKNVESAAVVAPAPTPPPRDSLIQVSSANMADLLHLAEELSLWRPGMSRTYFRAFDDAYGLESTDKKRLRKFAFLRNELVEREQKSRPAPTFEHPFGPAGLMPVMDTLPDKFWQAILAVSEPGAIARAMTGILTAGDAEIVADTLSSLATRVEEITAQDPAYQQSAERLAALLQSEAVEQLLGKMASFVGTQLSGLRFQVHPVWAPAGADLEAVAYGDRVLITVSADKPVGPEHAALVLHEIGRSLLARLSTERKALVTIRFAEKAGIRGDLFPLTEGVLDALSHGLGAKLLTSAGGKLPGWPGEARQKNFAEALLPLLTEFLNQGKSFDGVFARQAAEIHFRVNPPRPADYLGGAMVIAEDRTILPFRAKVVRWTVWKFPPSKKYNYLRKLGNQPGRSVLLLFTPHELRTLRERFRGQDDLLAAMKQAAGYMQRKQPVIIAVPRKSRGYMFVVAAPSPKSMKKIAQAFFALERIPDKVVEID